MLLHWAKASGRPYLYWVARRETAEATRQSLAQALQYWAAPGEQKPAPPRYDSWEQLFEYMLHLIGTQPLLIIFDEFSYAVESDPALPCPHTSRPSGTIS